VVALLAMATSIKNKAAAPVQITAEQLLREAAERQQEADFKKPKQKIVDTEELAELQLGKRQGVTKRESFSLFFVVVAVCCECGIVCRS
jgi:hypothetical protein